MKRPIGGGGADVREYAMGLRFQQQSAEVRALQYQAYNLARLRLDQMAAAGPVDGLAVVTDLDETVIDNTALLARDLAAGRAYDDWRTWRHWEREGNPPLIPGAREFLDHADGLGFAIYYLSDRDERQAGATLATLRGLGLPQVAEDRVLLLGSPKEDRRAVVAARHRVVMLLGDTLPDFDAGFLAGLGDQQALVAANADRFGAEWIIFPNAAYGSWAGAALAGWEAAVVDEPW
ncbi:MAG: HAD family acid phosphatase [Paracoccus sp. (in: a-proteobacteria)]|uniref:5'-nucleotidase, lipoprotein e(P4) family n=1 Tax=Paracoccus sp. TaxID=267 RepID=UPI0026E10449|nr:HAD family acid phosphatase [Paracoccus sp. (in: a-proteobacteria)]MDO5632565.1 HAD family acid phosphatase [Paracoccus sp. (in: a-proteobacteria)]